MESDIATAGKPRDFVLYQLCCVTTVRTCDHTAATEFDSFSSSTGRLLEGGSSIGQSVKID